MLDQWLVICDASAILKCLRCVYSLMFTYSVCAGCGLFSCIHGIAAASWCCSQKAHVIEGQRQAQLRRQGPMKQGRGVQLKGGCGHPLTRSSLHDKWICWPARWLPVLGDISAVYIHTTAGSETPVRQCFCLPCVNMAEWTSHNLDCVCTLLANTLSSKP